MTTSEIDSPAADWARWHAEREEALAAPHGWLSLTALHWLDDQPRRFPGVPGEWRVADGAASVTATAGEGLVVDGQELDGTAEVTVEEAGSTLFASYGDDVRAEVALRTGRYALRTRDPRAPARTGFPGVPAFEVRPKWVVDAEFTPYDEPRTVVVGGAQEGLRHNLVAAGEVWFTLDGAEQALVVSATADGLAVLFRDGTNGDTTAPWRSLLTGAPQDGRVRIDFNRATNLPYAFSDHGTCPQPPEGNVITIPVEAGERAPIR